MSTPVTPLRRRAARALERQRAYQAHKAREVEGHEPENVEWMRGRSTRVRGLLERAAPLSADGRVLEVGCGGRGLIFFFESAGLRVGLDPLEADYVRLFPAWRCGVPTVAAAGESLPFPDASFDVVLCENVIDHAEKPEAIVSECVRVLAPAGQLFFSVNVHHGLYAVASRVYGAARAVGVPIEIGPFADHTVHLTPAAARRLLEAQPVRIVWQEDNVARARGATRTTPPRHLGDRLKRLFFKNARYEMVVVKEPPAGRPLTRGAASSAR